MVVFGAKFVIYGQLPENPGFWPESKILSTET